MTTSILLFVVMFAWVAWFVLSPLLNDDKTDPGMLLDNTEDSQKTLQQKRSELMMSLKDLDFDFETGKLSKEDYQGLRKKYEAETIDVLKQIDAEKELWDKFQDKLDQTLAKK